MMDGAAMGELEARKIVPSLDDLLTLAPDVFVARFPDIGAVNLACARGLPNCDESAFPDYLALLDTIADAVKKTTERSWRLFKIKPKEFSHSENVFRIMTMEYVFRSLFGVKYDDKVREITASGKPWMSDDSSELFIHGLLSDKRTGTCSSLPTFAIAVGRRLGYPLHLILVPNHTLYRWDDGTEVFNLQPHEFGGDVKPDDFFHTWPRKWTQDDFAMNDRTKVWLHSLSPKRVIAKFLCNRALMLRDCKRWKEALHAIEAAGRFDPGWPALYDIQHSIEYGMYGGDVRGLVDGTVPDTLGTLQGGPIFSRVGTQTSLDALVTYGTELSVHESGRDNVNLVANMNAAAWDAPEGYAPGRFVNHITMPIDHQKMAESEKERRFQEEIAFSDEHYRLVNAINEANRLPHQSQNQQHVHDLMNQLSRLLRSRREFRQ